jgi:hypothetical protein
MDEHSMLGYLSNKPRVGRAQVLPRRSVVAGLQRRLRARDEVPAWGQIVLRTGSQTLR